MTLLSNKTTYYIARKTKKSEGDVIEPIYYNSIGRIYTPTSDYNYATPYTSQQETEKRVTILNMLAQLEPSDEAQISYLTIKRSETLEEMTSEL